LIFLKPFLPIIADFKEKESDPMTIQGKAIITGQIEAVTGLHIGAASSGLEIGGVEHVVVRNPLDNLPYIPGSSLKGKMRALLERSSGLAELNNMVWAKKNEVRLHLCDDPNCFLCNIFGRNNGKQTKMDGSQIEIQNTSPTRLLVRDGKLVETSLKGAETDLPYTEVKWEVSIDRITSAANPRQMERAPAGAVFDFEMIYTIYNALDRNNLLHVFKAMSLLEDDYLGGQGSRGSGKIRFKSLNVDWRPKAFYDSGKATDAQSKINAANSTVAAILTNFSTLTTAIQFAGE
jgi:CRISPR-associated protein Csm3